ncbi:methyltransferase [Spirillospora sp. NPDC047279]|uniref:methyltransferase n=1 Tax=Spirillospora sp. NPDC047279 TaxID=3155478 RepID=UPI0034023456
MADANADVRRKIMGFIVSQAIHAVCELEIPERLAAGPATTAALAESAGADADALRRFLRVLAAEDLVTQEPGDTFALTPAGRLLCADEPGSLRHFAELMSGEAYVAWSRAAHSLRTGEAAFDAVYGSPYFDWLAGHPEEAEAFNRAQAGLVELRLLPLLEWSWGGAGTVVDVGGGNGVLMSALLAARPELKGVVFDLPHVVDEASRTLDAAGLGDRARCAGGDFFAGVPDGGDVYVLAQILHDWADDEAVAILRRCREAMPGDGVLLLLEQVVPEDGGPHPAKLLDLHMLVLLGGRERTAGEWEALLGRGGFGLAAAAQGPRSTLIEARPLHHGVTPGS